MTGPSLVENLFFASVTRMRAIACVFLIGVAASACQQPGVADAAPLPAASTAPSTSAPTPLALNDPGKSLPRDDEQLQRYIRYERDRLALVQRLMDQLQHKRVAASAPATAPTRLDAAAAAELLAAPAAYRSQLEQGSSALREQAGLSAMQVEQISALVDAVIVARLAWQQAGGDEHLASIERRFRDQVVTLPAAGRAPVEAEFKQMIGEVTAMRDAAEARRTYGDAAVERVLARAAELTALRELQFKLGEQL